MENIARVIIIGAGPAGMTAAGRLGERNIESVILERNNYEGRKLRITGKGRCNITNSADIEDFFANIPTNPKFLYSALYGFTNNDMIALLNSLGVKTKIERGGRVFPESDRAEDVSLALRRYAEKKGKIIKRLARELIVENSQIAGVRTDKGDIYADNVILATGGCSYPVTGSDGTGMKTAEAAGHTIITPKPSLVPIVTEEKFTAELMGLSLKNVKLTVVGNKEKTVFSQRGEMLFTHFGISGPLVLSASSRMRPNEKYRLFIDLKPALDIETLDKRLLRDFEKYRNKHIINALGDLLPKAVIPVIISLSGIQTHTPVNEITKEQRRGLCAAVKAVPLTFKEFRPIDEAIITSGGIKTGEINPSTMESKLIKGLYFAGEIIDVDAYTGGFNLQIAYSTGYLAGDSIADKLTM
ncbi:MAG: NAD(P)/FAD-dependent oxidoreductase [Oscillospiraceae bacterium]|nr:NAD(P)/FAD-dependent oxidoreductase [Oscillospiraceae bacterium]